MHNMTRDEIVLVAIVYILTIVFGLTKLAQVVPSA
jgi:hypothetical protein